MPSLFEVRNKLLLAEVYTGQPPQPAGVIKVGEYLVGLA